MNRELEECDLGITIVKGACNVETKDLAVEVCEIAIHRFVEEGLVQELPFLKSVVACRKTWQSIRDQLFLRKVAGFISACPKFSEAEKERFAVQHLHDDKKAKQLGDAIVLILDNLDDLEKPEMLAKIFAALVRGKIGFDIFRRLEAAIDIGFVEDLKAFANLSHPTAEEMRRLFPQMLRTGLTEMKGPRVPGEGGMVGVRLDISDLGKWFIDCMRDDASSTAANGD